MHHSTTFNADWPKSGRDIAVFRFFKMAAVRHLDLLYACFTTHEEYFVVFVAVQSMVGIGSHNIKGLIFLALGLKMPIRVPFGGVFGVKNG